MTKRQRAQVAELLRCAADGNTGIGSALVEMTGEWLTIWHPCLKIWSLAVDARAGIWRAHGQNTDYRHTCIEAALRVEQGESP